MNSTIELRSQVIDGRRPGAHLLITAGVHGDEFEPMVAVRRLTEAIDPAELHGMVTLVPCVNDAAFGVGRRMADDGLDLARICPGRADGSVTERAAFALAQLIRSADYYIDLHTGGTVLQLLPLVGYTLHRDRTLLDEQRRMARAFGLPIIWGTTAELDGRSLSVARDARVPAIYAEWGGGGRYDERGTCAYVESCLDVMAELDMIERERLPRPIEHLVEDPRPASGHLQLCYGAPFEGIFEPRVSLGDCIQCGDQIGMVTGVHGQRSAHVESTQTGLVICLRTFPHVREGDSLAAVLEI